VPSGDLEALKGTFDALVNEARAAVAAGRDPGADALEERVRELARAEREGASGKRRAAVDSAEAGALRRLRLVLAVARARALVDREPPRPQAPPPPPRPARALLRSRPTISGNMVVRRQGTVEDAAIAWEPARAVTRWEVRFSERPDPRSEYVVRETRTLPAEATSVEVPLGDLPLRVHVLGHGRDGRLLRRTLISALTKDTWDARWQQRASAS
jgi:hypothetical protein